MDQSNRSGYNNQVEEPTMTKISPLMSVRQMIMLAQEEGIPMSKLRDRDGNLLPKPQLVAKITAIINDPNRPYFILETRERDETEWYPQFGSYDRADCISEWDSYRSRGTAKRIVRCVGNTNTVEA